MMIFFLSCVILDKRLFILEGKKLAVLLKDAAYEQLLLMINQGELHDGIIYSLTTLAEKLQMSKTPVRDAIQRLSDEKRIDILPSRGIRLHQMSVEERIQHYHFSNAIEGYCLLKLTEHRNEKQYQPYIETMKFSLNEMEKCLSNEISFAKYFQFDQMFHQQILESLEDAYFSSLQHSIKGFYAHPEVQSGSDAISREQVYLCHKNILNCVLLGDAFGAYEALMEHSAMFIKNKQE